MDKTQLDFAHEAFDEAISGKCSGWEVYCGDATREWQPTTSKQAAITALYGGRIRRRSIQIVTLPSIEVPKWTGSAIRSYEHTFVDSNLSQYYAEFALTFSSKKDRDACIDAMRQWEDCGVWLS